ncbi:APC family permease [Granulicella mallensis]|uniref:Amino acid permease-associated region n=1 Tax=Granulicella mallensis (strain ATCC BAA-1857 / DSM 23137 / MP5ACTX8) TaxID=682795 RepID=G8NUE7_GRAMM|nr:APC family permease [Granulicella mallensis]AEU35303.1 amino acid permease-associated region [Granulicella mallensis MP5ACTX8]
MQTLEADVPAPQLKRSLKLWHLIVYGIVIIQPTAPMGIYGVVNNVARGHVVTTILIAMVAMLFTAVSYGRMARIYPSAGSAYTYVGREINPLAGYVVGWSMLMDYLLNPIICAIWCSAAAANVLPNIPYAAWAVAFVLLFTLLNLRGVKASGQVNAILAVGMSLVVVVFLAYAIRYLAFIARPIGGQWLTPFYDPTTFSPSLLLRGTSIAVLTYIGFDGISTMSEEVENPRRNIMLATVFTCLIIGILSAGEVYVAQLAWPYHGPFPEAQVDTAYVHVARRIGGSFLFQLLNATLLIANLGSGVAAQFGAARLLYGMGRGGALPQRFFGALNQKNSIPRNNVLLVGAITLVGVFVLTYERGAELLNFGAFIAFMGVNAAALIHYRFRSTEKVLLRTTIPLAGLVVSAFIWLNLGRNAQILGFTWIALGLGLYWLRRNGRADAAAPSFE